MKRSAGILFLAIWLAGVSWYWRENVPLVPTKSVALPVDRNLATLSPTGELIVSSSRSLDRRERRMGPFEFWSFPELKKVREAFFSTDEIVQSPDYRTGDILIRRDGKLMLCNLYSEAVLTTLPDMAEVRAFSAIHDRQAILLQSDRDLFLYEFNKSEPAWKAADVRLRGRVAGDILIAKQLSYSNPRIPTTVGTTAIVVASGEFDHRFDQLGPAARIDLSPDGRWALVHPQRGQPLLCDAATGRPVWTIPDVRVDWWFSESGDLIYGHSGHDARLIRRSSSDGTLLSPLEGQAFRQHQRQVTGDGRFAHVDANNTPPGAVQQWYNQATYLPNSWRDPLYNLLNRQRSKVIDQQMEWLIGYFPDHVRPVVLKNNLGFATYTPGRMTYYALPPLRDWSWLGRWALLPPAILILMARAWPWIRRRRQMDSLSPT
jgi:hypothetical protein